MQSDRAGRGTQKWGGEGGGGRVDWEAMCALGGSGWANRGKSLPNRDNHCKWFTQNTPISVASMYLFCQLCSSRSKTVAADRDDSGGFGNLILECLKFWKARMVSHWLDVNVAESFASCLSAITVTSRVVWHWTQTQTNSKLKLILLNKSPLSKTKMMRKKL